MQSLSLWDRHTVRSYQACLLSNEKHCFASTASCLCSLDHGHSPKTIHFRLYYISCSQMLTDLYRILVRLEFPTYCMTDLKMSWEFLYAQPAASSFSEISRMNAHWSADKYWSMSNLWCYVSSSCVSDEILRVAVVIALERIANVWAADGHFNTL